jgi:hypothetical protein
LSGSGTDLSNRQDPDFTKRNACSKMAYEIGERRIKVKIYRYHNRMYFKVPVQIITVIVSTKNQKVNDISILVA